MVPSSRPHPDRRGFTLIELLVVISIIAVLIALLLPAVQSGAKAARRAQCINNFKQTGIGMHNYHSVSNVFPPGRYDCCWGTWQVYILPYIEQVALYNAWNQGNHGQDTTFKKIFRYGGSANLTVTTQRINSLTCPSDIPTSISGITLHNIAVSFGNTDSAQDATFASPTTGATLPFLGAPFTNLNAFFPQRAAPFPQNFCYGLRDITDGSSATLIAGEVIQGQSGDNRGYTWWGDSTAFETALLPNSPLPDILAAATCVPPVAGPGGTGFNGLNPPCFNDPAGTIPEVFASRSRHPGGVNVLMADGSVKFIKNSINYTTWQALSTTQGSEVVSSDAY